MGKRNLKRIPSDRIDEQIDFYLQRHHPDVQDAPTFRAVRNLERYYAPRSDAALPLERVHQRLKQQVAAHSVTQLASHPDEIAWLKHGTFVQRERPFPQKPPRTVGAVFHALGFMAAAVLLVLLVGSLLLVMNARFQTTVGGSHRQTITASLWGHTVYVTPAHQSAFNGLSWSPDSKRVAASTTDVVQIWDATTGQHLVTVPLPGGSAEWAYGLSWSPEGQLVAVATDKHLLLVNGQTGQIVHRYSAPTVAVSAPIMTSGSPLSALLPTSGGTGYMAVTWSPDGHYLAASLNTGGASGSMVQVFDASTFTPSYSLSFASGVVDVAWSPDGHYLAASVGAESAGNQIAVWRLSTHRVVFLHPGGNGAVGDLVAWQPQSHNLAFVNMNGQTDIGALEIWNPVTNQLLKRYQGLAFGPLTWSPDGSDIAYVANAQSVPNPVNPALVVILDTQSGKQVFTYKGHQNGLNELSWSPDGKYIVSGEGQSPSQNSVARVWTA